MTRLVIDAAHTGLPELAHGGYVAGLLTVALGSRSSRVRLRRPVPSARALRMERPGPGQVELHDGATVVADAAAADVLLDVPAAVGPEEAGAASRRAPGAGRHPFPRCLGCGPEHPRGLGVLPGPVSGRGVVAAR